MKPSITLLTIAIVLVWGFGCKPKTEQAGTATPTDSTTIKAESLDLVEQPDTTQAPMDSSLVEGSPAVEMDYAAWSELSGLTVDCGGTALDLSVPVNEIATRIEALKLDYDVEPFSDCSGIFHRVLDSMNRRCPQHEYPSPKKYRDSRSLGRWYQDQGAFVRISDPLNQSQYIKPGAVMFYGGRGANLDTMATEAFFKRGGINHVGVVVNVETDDKTGEITGYWLFHGQRPGKKASVTKYHKRKYPTRPNYPAYGNGSEQWIAVAPLIVDVKS